MLGRDGAEAAKANVEAVWRRIAADRGSDAPFSLCGMALDKGVRRAFMAGMFVQYNPDGSMIINAEWHGNALGQDSPYMFCGEQVVTLGKDGGMWMRSYHDDHQGAHLTAGVDLLGSGYFTDFRPERYDPRQSSGARLAMHALEMQGHRFRNAAITSELARIGLAG